MTEQELARANKRVHLRQSMVSVRAAMTRLKHAMDALDRKDFDAAFSLTTLASFRALVSDFDAWQDAVVSRLPRFQKVDVDTKTS